MKIIFTLIIVSFYLFSSGQETTLDNIQNKAERYMSKHHENGKFNGNLLLTKGNQVVYNNSFGLANREFKINHTDSTKFLIGSITKTFTALAILILEQEQQLKLDDKLSRYFPDFNAAHKITIEQLLTHTSGIADYKILNDWKEDSKSDLTTPYTTIAKMSKEPLLFEPGERFRYSNVGYIILGLIIEKTSNLSFEDFIQFKILDPLQLTSTGVVNNENVIDYLAQGYTSNPRETLKAAYINYGQPFSSGNMYSTTNDLRIFTEAVMNSELLSQEKTHQIFANGEHYGYGWGIRSFDGIKAYGHYGGMNGFVSAITYMPDGEYLICMLTNDDNTPKITITNDLVSIIKGKDVQLPLATKLIDSSSEMFKEVEGTYRVEDASSFNVFEDKGRLFLQEDGQAKHELFPFEDRKFSLELLEFNVVFESLKVGKTQVMKFVGSETILEANRVVLPK